MRACPSTAAGRRPYLHPEAVVWGANRPYCNEDHRVLNSPPIALGGLSSGAEMTQSQPRQRILSGVQPSGKLHLGNYFGAIKNHIELQDRGEAFYFIADYHAL